MEGEEGEVQMANYSPAWRAHAAGARLVQCLQGLGRGRGLDALGSRGRSKSGSGTKTQRRGQIAAAKKKKEKKKTARKLGAQCPSLANQCGRAGVGSWGSFAPHRLQSHRLQEKEQENKKKSMGHTKETPCSSRAGGDLA